MMASCDVYTVDELVGKRNAVLKNILREAGKPSSGTKAQLVQRILSFQIRKSATTQAAIGEKLESIRLAENQLSQLKSELTRLESSVHVHNQTGGDNFMPDPTHESSPKPDIFQATHQENPDIDYHYIIITLAVNVNFYLSHQHRNINRYQHRRHALPRPDQYSQIIMKAVVQFSMT